MTIGLRGTPLEPDATAVVEKRIPCRKKTVFTFPLKNWLKHPQRFHVERDFQGLDHNDEEPFFVDGLDHVDVPGLMEREYRLTIVDYRVRRTNGRVRFVNEETGDYLFFDVKVDSVAADPLEVISLTSTFIFLSSYSSSLFHCSHSSLVVAVAFNSFP